MVVLAFIGSVVCAQSDPSRPSTKAADKAQAKPAGKAPRAQPGSKDAPLFIEGQVTTAKSSVDVDRDAVDEQAKSQRETWAAAIAGIAAGIAAIVAFIAALQLRMFRRQLGLMKDQMKQARREYLAAHAPKLIIRRVFLAETEDKKPFISYAVTNVGDSDAIVVESNISPHVQPKRMDLGSRPPFNDGRNALGKLRVKVGETVTRTVPVPNLTDQQYVIDRQDTYDVYFFGWMTYRNVGGNRRYTSFCRVYDPKFGGFKVVRQPDDVAEYDRYEYSN